MAKKPKIDDLVKRARAVLGQLGDAYMAEVNGIAAAVEEDIKKARILSGEQACQAIEEACNGNAWATNDVMALAALFRGDNSGYGLSEGLVDIDRTVDPCQPILPFASLAGYAMERDVKEAVMKLGIDLNAESYGNGD